LIFGVITRKGPDESCVKSTVIVHALIIASPIRVVKMKSRDG